MRYVSIDIETSGLDPETCQVLEIGMIIEDCKNPLPFEQAPKLKLVIDRQFVSGQPYAINMNARIFKLLAEAQDMPQPARNIFKMKNNIVAESEVPRLMWEFLYLNGFGEKYDPVRAGVPEPGGLSYDAAMQMIKNDKEGTLRLYLPQRNSRGQLKVNVAGKNFSTFDKLFLEKIQGFTQLIRFKQRILDPSSSYIDFINDEDAPGMAKCMDRLYPALKHETAHDSIEDAWDVICLLRPLYETYSLRMTHMRTAASASNNRTH